MDDPAVPHVRKPDYVNSTALLHQSIFCRLAGYDDINDAERLSVNPVMRQLVSGRAGDGRKAQRVE